LPTLIILFLLSLPTRPAFSQQSTITTQQYKDDFNFFWNSINDEYCYFNKKQTDWQKVKDIYGPLIDKVENRNQFVAVVEKALYEIYDHHAILNTNTDSSRRLVPSGTDIWAEYVNGKPLITEVRKDFGASSSGIVAGMEIIAINDKPVNKSVDEFLPRSLKRLDEEARNFTLRIMLAGNHIQPRKLSLKYNGTVKDFYPDKNGVFMDIHHYPSLIESRLIGSIGYIRINDCLYDNSLIQGFDSAMAALSQSSALSSIYMKHPAEVTQ
jgi:carboxyl-terminal processing protease